MKRLASVVLTGVMTAWASTGAITPTAEVQAPDAALAQEEVNPRLKQIAEAMSRVHEVRVTPMNLVLYWNDGVYVLDFGGAGKGGAPTKPVAVSKLAYPEGNTHHTYRYGKYLLTADEIFGCDQCWGGDPRGFHPRDRTFLTAGGDDAFRPNAAMS